VREISDKMFYVYLKDDKVGECENFEDVEKLVKKEMFKDI
jgi:hypothetical protein